MRRPGERGDDETHPNEHHPLNNDVWSEGGGYADGCDNGCDNACDDRCEKSRQSFHGVYMGQSIAAANR